MSIIVRLLLDLSIRQRVNEEAIEEIRHIRQLDDLLTKRRIEVLRKLDQTQSDLAIIQERILTSQSDYDRMQDNFASTIQEHGLLSPENHVIREDAEKINQLNLHIDSMIATREEFKRVIKRLRDEIEFMDEQYKLMRLPY
jgi:hypothetical protein